MKIKNRIFTPVGSVLCLALASCTGAGISTIYNSISSKNVNTGFESHLSSLRQHELRTSSDAAESETKDATQSLVNITKSYNVTSYSLQARVDWQAKKMLASNTITFFLETPSATQIKLNSNVQVEKVTSADESRELEFEVDEEKGFLIVQIPKSETGIVDWLRADNGRQAQVKVHYETEFPNTRKGAFGSERGLMVSELASNDPDRTQFLYSDSEPDGASLWMPCNVDPNDRAKIRFEFDTNATHNFVANGKKLSETINDNRKTTVYSMDKAIPAYVTAFATGNLEETTQKFDDDTQLSIWSRPSVTPFAKANLDAVSKMMTFLEGRLGEYPWGDYGVVLVPEFGGGEENVGLTFQDESDGYSLASELDLHAHELAHQWFGNLITVRAWDDLWIKEGMASLLGTEFNFVNNGGKSGTSVGMALNFNSTDAIVDKSLAPIDKYTSGPYRKAAAFYNQIRQKLGEEAFWSFVREILNDYAMSSVSTENVLDLLSKRMSRDDVKKIAEQLNMKHSGKISIQKVSGGYLFDYQKRPAGDLLPLEYQKLDLTTGQLSDLLTVDEGQSFNFAVGSRETLIIDPRGLRGIHDISSLNLQIELEGEDAEELLSTNQIADPKHIYALFEKLPSERVINLLMQSEAESSTSVYTGLAAKTDSFLSKYTLVNLGCSVAKTDSDWALINKAFKTLDFPEKGTYFAVESTDLFGNSSYWKKVGTCKASKIDQIASLQVKDFESGKLSHEDLYTASHLDIAPSRLAEIFYDGLYKSAGSVLERNFAIRRLRHSLTLGFTGPSEADPFWIGFLEEMIELGTDTSLYTAATIVNIMGTSEQAKNLMLKTAENKYTWWEYNFCWVAKNLKNSPADLNEVEAAIKKADLGKLEYFENTEELCLKITN